ncbi:MAG TPA: FkbM family methyltransferase [Acidobacteriaceae bacterium]|nr:FkbM family methyltransferase [Nitrospira sp.]HEV2274428.1 FkbM family methyltransferase [Acidobacteriaceae bacterium]
MRIANYEIVRYHGHTIDGEEIRYLRGLEFADFLGMFLRKAHLSAFFFIQIGAHNGVSNDHLHDSVLKFNLPGILVEPQPQVFAELQRNYSNCSAVTLENVAVADREGETTFYTINPELTFLQYANQIASLNRDHTRRMIEHHLAHEAAPEIVREFKARGLSADTCIVDQTVRSTTFASLMTKHSVPRYELLQIDAEGYDYQILKTAGIERYKPSLINYEHEHLNESDREASWRYLKSLGYRLFTHDIGDTAAFLLS